jgi:rod shape-determining protein MreD
MKIKYIIPLFIFIPVALIQLTVIPFVSIQEILPDLLTIAVVYFSIAYGQIFGTITGASYGLMYDLISGSLVLYTYSFTLVVFISALIDTIIFSFFSVIDFNTNFLTALLNHALMPSIFTSLVSILVVVVPYKRAFD